MVYMGGFTCRETAEFLNTPLGTILSRIHRAKQYLCQFLMENSDQHFTPSRTDEPTKRKNHQGKT